MADKSNMKKSIVPASLAELFSYRVSMNKNFFLLISLMLSASCSSYKLASFTHAKPSCVLTDSGKFKSVLECEQSEDYQIALDKYRSGEALFITQDEDLNTECTKGKDIKDGVKRVTATIFDSVTECTYSAEMEKIKVSSLQKSRDIKIQKYLKKNKAKPEFIAATKKGSVMIGMPKELLLISVGKPDRVNASGGSFGRREQLIYGDTYIYTENGYVTSWQSPE